MAWPEPCAAWRSGYCSSHWPKHVGCRPGRRCLRFVLRGRRKRKPGTFVCHGVADSQGTAGPHGSSVGRAITAPTRPRPISERRIADEARRIADLAAQEEIRLVFEFHKDTLTQTGESCAALMEAVDHANARVYWQPAPELDVNENLAQLRCVLPWLVGLHVFHWRPTHMDRHPLAQGESDWAQYLALAESAPRHVECTAGIREGGHRRAVPRGCCNIAPTVGIGSIA